jgi:hypothetical protein
MSAAFWTALSVKANLQTTQQREIAKYLQAHFGFPVVVPKKELASYGSTFVDYEIFYKEFNGKKVQYSFRSIPKMLLFYLPEFLKEFKKPIETMEIMLGGDHGKGSFTFLATLAIRFADRSDPYILEMQVGEIASAQDSVELLKPLVKKLEEGLKDVMKPTGDGDCKFVVHHAANNDLKLYFEDTEASEDTRVVTSSVVQLYLVGDWKFLFMMLGRSGYCGNYCMYCRLSKAQWKLIHSVKETCNCEGEKWTIKKLHDVVTYQNQHDNNPNGRTPYTSVGVREFPLWSFIAVERVLIPVLHELLGLGNDLLTHWWTWVEVRYEPMDADEIVARNMALLAEIAVIEAQKQLDDCQVDLEALVFERQELRIFLRDKNIQPLEREVLIKDNTEIEKLVRQTQKECNEAKTKLKDLKKAATATKEREAALRSDKKRADMTLCNSIESEVLKKWYVFLSAYHGRQLEGPAI